MNKFIRVAIVLTALSLLATVPPGYCQTPTWQPTAGPEGGFITDLVIDSQGHLFAATLNSGVFRSTDRGEHWTSNSSGIWPLGVYSLGYSPHSDSLFVSQNTWIYRSTDHGESWLSTFHVEANTIVARSDGFLMAGTWDRGVMRSTDDGVTWEQVGEGVLPPWVTSLGFDSDGHVYAGARQGVFVSENDGDTWSLVPGSENFDVMALGVDPFDQDLHVALNNLGLGQPASDGSTFRYDSITGAWTRTPNVGLDAENKQWYFYHATQFAFDGHGAIYVSTRQNTGVSRSLNHGLTWEYIGVGRDQRVGGGGLRTTWAVAVHPDGTVFAGSSGDGVFKWTGNGLEWIRLVNGMPASDVSSLLVARDGAVLAGTYQIGIFRSPDRGGTWRQLRSDWINECWPIRSMAMNGKGQIFAAWGGVSRSDDGGATWPSPYDTATPDSYMYTLAISPQDEVYVGGMFRTWKSTDDGAIWDELTGMRGADVRSMAVDSEGRVFAGTLISGTHSGLYRSEDHGESWQQVGFNGEYLVRSIAISPVNGDIFVSKSDQKIYRSSDHGDTWTELQGWAVVIAINAEGRIFTGSATSTDNGATWQPFDDGLRTMYSGQQILSLVFDADGYLYAGHLGGGVSRTTETTFLHQLSALGPADVWVGLKNSDDVGTRFDLLAEVLVNGAVVSSGQANYVSGGSSGFNNAVRTSVSLAVPPPTVVGQNGVLALRLSVRNTCFGKTHNSGWARLWFNDAAANSHVDATIGADPASYYLVRNFALDTAPGAGPRQYVDVSVGRPCSAWKPFGAWSASIQ